MAEYIDIDAQVVVTDTRGCEHETTVRHIFEMNKGVYTAADVVERKTGKWINYLEDCFVECPFCHSATNCDISELHYCFNCGAKLEGDDD